MHLLYSDIVSLQNSGKILDIQAMNYFLVFIAFIGLYAIVNFTVNRSLYFACKRSRAYSKILETILSSYIDKGFKSIQIFKGVSFEFYLGKVKSDRQTHLSRKAYESYLEFNLFRRFKCIRFINQYSSELKTVIIALEKKQSLIKLFFKQ